MRFLFLTVPAALALSACNAGPDGRPAQDSVRNAASPATKELRADSPARAQMPVARPDTARQADMPVVTPPKNIRPK